MDTFIYSNEVAVVEKLGKRLVSSIKPAFSFNYDEIQFHQSNKGYVTGGAFINFTDEQSNEVASYIESVVEDVVVGEAVKINTSNHNYLFETDWMVIRELETGVVMPSDVREKRAEARAAITVIT